MFLRCNINAFEKRRNEHCKQKNMNALRFLSLFYPNSIAFNLQHVDYINAKVLPSHYISSRIEKRIQTNLILTSIIFIRNEKPFKPTTKALNGINMQFKFTTNTILFSRFYIRKLK